MGEFGGRGAVMGRVAAEEWKGKGEGKGWMAICGLSVHDAYTLGLIKHVVNRFTGRTLLMRPSIGG
eukprot:746110-Pyramimonas_sp.AAC.1